MQTEYYAKRHERDGHGERLRALKAEQEMNRAHERAQAEERAGLAEGHPRRR